MIYVLTWRANVPTVVSYLAGYELDSEAFPTLSAALVALAILKGW